jgi:hypothetical protein
MSDNHQAQDDIGRVADTLDNLIAALQMPLPDRMHIVALRAALPDASAALKAAYVAAFGENPWQT